MTLKKKLAFLAIVYGTVILLVVVVEMALRLSRSETTTRLRYAYSDDVLGDFLPNQRLQDTRRPRLPWRVTINADGYRGRRVTVPKPPGVAWFSDEAGKCLRGLRELAARLAMKGLDP